MPRTLPWLTGTESKDATPRKRTIKPQQDLDSDKDKTPKASKKAAVDFEKSDILRSCELSDTVYLTVSDPSTASPPTQSIRRCPSEEYLIEGFDNDDIYMMVEDEFYAVAQRFTQHLHYAEYVRRTKEVKSQNAARIRDIARPTDGITPMSEETKKKKEAEALAARQKAGMEQVQETTGHREGNDDNDGDDDDDMWAGTSLLDLMTSPRKARSLVGGTRGIKSATRAAAGYVQTSQNSATTAGLPSSSPLGHRQQERQHRVLDETASEDDDDLDVQPTITFKRTVHDINTPKTEPNTERSNISSIAPTKSTPANNSTRNSEKANQTPSINARNKTQAVFNPRKKLLFDDFDELPEPKSNISMQEKKSKSSSIASTPNGSRSGDNKGSKKSRLNEVPMFLL